MTLSWKRAFGVGGFLAGLCAVLALAIAGGHLATKERIARNKIEKENSSLALVFGAEATYSAAVEIQDGNYPTLKKYWTVALPGDPLAARVYSASNKNGYGTVSLLVGVYGDFRLGNIAILENSESFGPMLEEGYFEPYLAATDKEAAVEQVKCGATEGAKMTRDMIRMAQRHFRQEGDDE